MHVFRCSLRGGEGSYFTYLKANYIAKVNYPFINIQEALNKTLTCSDELMKPPCACACACVCWRSQVLLKVKHLFDDNWMYFFRSHRSLAKKEQGFRSTSASCLGLLGASSLQDRAEQVSHRAGYWMGETEMKVFWKLQMLIHNQELVVAVMTALGRKQWGCRLSPSTQTWCYSWVKGTHGSKNRYHWGMTTFASTCSGKSHSTCTDTIPAISTGWFKTGFGEVA